MPLGAYIEDAGSGQRRPIPWAASAALHATAFILLMHSPTIRLPEQAPSAYKQAIAGRETKLVWYRFEKKLPSVKPPDARAERTPVRAEVKAPQAIVASRRDAPKRTQIVWTAAPELREPRPVDLPNIIAIKLPEIAKPFVAPPAKPPDAPKINVPDAPLLERELGPVKLAGEQRITRKFVAPPVKVPEKLKQVEAPSDAPQLEARSLASPLNESFKAPARPFTAPLTKSASAKIARPSIDEPPPDPISNSRELNAVVAGLNPAAMAPILPPNSSPGQFSAGPKVRPDGADSAGDRKGFAVPDLYVQGAKDAKADLLAQAYAAPTSSESLRAAARLGNPRARIVDEDRPAAPAGAVKVSGAPDKRFDGRDVYMMAIQMPNLTSYSGSWLMWYADRTAREAGLAPISPPVAFRKVDPKYIASAAADRVEGKIQLACVIGRDGRVSHIELIHSLDERLNQAAEEAMSKWEFAPATRNGEPVDVDVLVEIPFRLAPPTRYPY